MASFEETGTVPAMSSAGPVLPASPEEMFLGWVLWLPADADIAECARIEIARIDGRNVADARVTRLRALFAEAAGPAVRPC